MIVSRALQEPYRTRHLAGATSSDVHDLLLNGVQ